MEDGLKTFLTLCREMNYRKTAEALHLSQPAVTKQIQSIERDYGVRLFSYDGRRLSMTEPGRLLEQYAAAQLYNEEEIRRALRKIPARALRIGATKSIGNYLLRPYLRRYLRDRSRQLSLIVDNTQHLLSLLDATELDFAVIEGFFSKQKYDCRLLRDEPFVGVCAPEHAFAGAVVEPEALLGQDIVVREEGSGTRNMLERALAELGYDLGIFDRVICSSSFHVIKDMVSDGAGVSFMYRAVAQTDARLATFSVARMAASHEFNAVWLKGTNAGALAEAFLFDPAEEE